MRVPISRFGGSLALPVESNLIELDRTVTNSNKLEQDKNR